MSKKKILVICHQSDNKCNGQIAKTNDIISFLKRNDFEIEILGYNKLNAFQKIFKSINAIKNNNEIIIMPGGKKPLFFYINLLSKYKNKNCHYVAIGGWVLNLLKDEKNNKVFNKLKHFKGIYLQNQKAVTEFNNHGFNNVHCIYSFSNKTPLSKEDIKNKVDSYDKLNEYKFCFYARVTKEKGIFLACDAIKELLTKRTEKISIDIYGEIVDPSIKEELDKISLDTKGQIKVCGVLGDDAIKTLSNYYCMLFPTFYKGEGIPHSIIESFMASLPVIASDWAYNSEVISEDKTGILFDLEKNNLVEKIEWAIDNKPEIKKMSSNCYIESQKYDIDELLKPLIKNIQE